MDTPGGRYYAEIDDQAPVTREGQLIFFMANTRMCLGVEVCGGKDHAARHGLPGLWSLPDALPRTHWPTFLRGDCGYGQEALLCAAETRELLAHRPAPTIPLRLLGPTSANCGTPRKSKPS